MALRILIADDHEIVRRGLRSLLTGREGWELCGEAVDGEDACAKVRELKPDVLVLDVNMPRMNGLEAARKIRKEQPELPIVVLSQHEAADMGPRAIEAGANRYVSKQEIVRDLVASIEEVMRARRPELVSGNGKAGASGGPVPLKAARPELQCIGGGGEVGALMRSMDWSKTPVGRVENWPQSLKTAVGICLSSRFDLLIWWGPELVMLYNDAYRRTLASKHPAALGRPGREIWHEIWDIIGPMLEKVVTTGEATWSDDLLLLLERHGYPEETYHTFSYTPIRDESGGVGGVFTPVTETTEQVIGERRLHTLRDLAARSADAKSEAEAWKICAEVLAQNPWDVPFAVLYRLDEEGHTAKAAAWAGIEEAHAFCRAEVQIEDREKKIARYLREVAKSRKPVEAHDVDGEALKLPGGAWDAPPHEMVFKPLWQSGQPRPFGVLAAGVNRRKLLDDNYRTFFNLVAGQIAKGVVDARDLEFERTRAQELAELDRAKTTFFSNVSHEFRTPLTLMLGPLEDALAHADDRVPAELYQNLLVSHRNSLRLLKLVNSLLDFSRIEAGRVQAVYQPTDLANFTTDLASVFRSAVERAGLKLNVDCATLPGPVYVDRDMWEKIVLNLLSNALKFTFEGEIRVELKVVDKNVELTVADTGTGIPEAELPRLFERFHRVEGARGRTFEGTGIGLALVQELANLHGGSVKVESEYGKGSKFTVSIPLGKTHLPADRIETQRTLASSSVRADSYVEEALRWLPGDEAPATTPASVLGSFTGGDLETKPSLQIGEERQLILLADDNADMREYLSRLLGERYRVHAVSNGADALEAVAELDPDLVLTDVMMPGVGGFEILKRLRENPATRPKPVILLSARAGEESRVEGLHAGADDYLVKPFTARELLARVGAHLTMARIRREAAERERELRRALERAHSDLEVKVLERTIELQRAEEDLRALSGRLLQTQDEERRRIARELHDSSGQMVTALGLNLAVLQREIKPDSARGTKTMNECLALVQEMSKELRTISHLLHPPLLDESGLGSALRWYVEGYAERSKIPVELEIPEDLGRLSSEMETAVFRIVQECLTNIHRHSGSDTAAIKLTRDAQQVRLEVRDYGKGMPTGTDGASRDGAKPGVGIRGMRERIKQLRGTIEITTSGNKGTVVIAVFPLAPDAATEERPEHAVN
ncbi:MAG TPA: response regulator [Candidatus Acidoferrales bacterium]|jgi:signal transduction histidine kinase|nr:response regulator [Candidatus Acidoferrales bacterium]